MGLIFNRGRKTAMELAEETFSESGKENGLLMIVIANQNKCNTRSIITVSKDGIVEAERFIEQVETYSKNICDGIRKRIEEVRKANAQ